MATEAMSACSHCLLGWPLNWAKKELNYVFNFKTFIDTLNEENSKLGPLLTDLNGFVRDAVDGDKAIVLETTKKFLGDMEEKHRVATELVDGNSIPNTCCWGFCGDCNYKHRRDVAKKADRLAKEIVDLVIKHGDKHITRLSKKPVRSQSDGKQQIEKLNRMKPNAAISSSNVQSNPQPLPATESDRRGEKKLRLMANNDSYINAAFRSCHINEAYVFVRNKYVRINYAPRSTNDQVLNGPLRICDGFPSLANTAFAEHGLDCAFGSHDSKEAYIFTGNLCAQINFAPRTTDDYIIKGPLTIVEMFPFFKGTRFANGVDAAFESSATYQAYVFKGNQYALINYKQPRLIGGPSKITDGFYSLKNTIFESGIEAAFASHAENEAYLFKKDQYALINFAPGGTNDYIINGPKKIIPNWPSLATVLPHKNHGLDLHEHSRPDPEHGHDDL